MSGSGLRATPGRGLLVVGAVLTVLAAAGFDLFAGEAPLHAATLGIITALAAALRVRLAGRHRSLLQFVCGCIVSQPALHYAAKWVPHPSVEHGTGHLPGAADLFAAGLQTMAILALVAALTFAEQILLTLAIGAARLCIVRIRSIRPLPERARFVVTVAPATESLIGRYYPGSIARRGPPKFATAF